MRRSTLLGLTAVLTAVAVVAVQLLTGHGDHRPTPEIHTVPNCPRGPAYIDVTPVHLVADLGHLPVPASTSGPALLATADQIVAGTIPPVRPDASGDPMRNLYDEGVALRRVAGVLGYAYAATHDPRYLDFLRAQTVGAVRWPDWNPAHPLDTAQIATAVALGYAWARDGMPAAEREEVVDTLVERYLAPYACGAGQSLSTRRAGAGNQATVAATAAVLAGFAVRADSPAWATEAVRVGAAALARPGQGSGLSLADGPTDEGLMYTSYAVANVALLQATLRANPHDPAVTGPLSAALPSLDALADWTERCGRVAEPAVEDGWPLYPWVDRTTALAAMASSPRSGPRLLGLIDALQAQGQVTVPGAGVWPAPDGIAELILARTTAGQAAVPLPQAHVSGGRDGARPYGCATNGDTLALLTGVPNDSPHAHQDVGNVVVMQGEQPVLDDLGQRTYSFDEGPVWRSATKAHSTIGVLHEDGSVLQDRSGSGAIAAYGPDLMMTSTTALPGVAGWARRVSVGDGSAVVRDVLTRDTVGSGETDGSGDGAGSGEGGGSGSTPVPLSMSFLLAAPPASVAQQPDGALRFTVADGSVWDLLPPPGTTATWSSAAPTPPYVDAPDVADAADAHTLVVLHAGLADTLDLTTTLRRVT